MDGRVIALMSCLLFATSTVFMKVLTQYISPLSLAALTSLTTSIIVVFLLEIKHKACEVTLLSKKQAVFLLFLGILTGVGAQAFMITGVYYSTAINAVLLTRLNSLLIALGGALFLKEKFTKNHVLGTAFMAAGVVIIATKNFTVNISSEYGDMFLILASFCWASANIIVKKYLDKLPPEVLILGRHIVSATFLTLLVFCIGTQPLTVQATTYITGYIIVAVLIAQYLWYMALEKTTATNVALTTLTIPLVGVVYANVFLKEQIFEYHIIGGSLIIIGLAAVEVHLRSLKDLKHRLKSIHVPHHH